MRFARWTCQGAGDGHRPSRQGQPTDPCGTALWGSGCRWLRGRRRAGGPRKSRLDCTSCLTSPPRGLLPPAGRGPSRAAEQDEHSRLCWDPVRPPGPCDHGAGPAAHPGWCPGLGAGSLAPLCGDPEVGGRLAVGVGAPSLCCCPPVSHWRELFQSSGSFGASSWGPSATSSPAGPPGGRPSSHTLLRTPLSSLQSWLLPPHPGSPSNNLYDRLSLRVTQAGPQASFFGLSPLDGSDL